MLPRTDYYASYREQNRQIPITTEERDHVGKFISNSIFSLGVSLCLGGVFAFWFGRRLVSNKKLNIRTGVSLETFVLYGQFLFPWSLFYVNYAYMIPRHGWEHFKSEQNYPGFIWRNLLAGDENFFGFQISEDSEYSIK